MEKCVRPSCEDLLGEKKVEVDGKVYCCQDCYEQCTDDKCVLKDSSCC